MMKFLFFLLVLLYFCQNSDPSYPSVGEITASSTKFCPAYVCQSQTLKTGCVTYQGSQLLMEGCLSDWYCNLGSSYLGTSYQLGTCTLKKSPFKYRKNVGEFCYQNTDCKSNYCTLNLCAVKIVGQQCDSSYECGKGMSCDSDTDSCQLWLTDGISCNGKYHMCAPGSGCISIDDAVTPVCTKYYSVGTNKISMIYGDTFNYIENNFCSTGSITLNGECLDTILSLSQYPKICTSDSDCMASNNQNSMGICECWPNTEGVKYCNPMPGDIPDAFNKKKQKMLTDFSKCYNFDITYNYNNCGDFDFNEDKSWAPQIKSGTWGSCYDAIGLKFTSYVLTHNGQCPQIKCNPGNNDEGYCLDYNSVSNLFLAQSCPTNYICGSSSNGDYSLYSSSTKCKAASSKTLAHKKEWCWVDNDCYSGICGTDKVCQALSLGQTCNTYSACDKGLTCYYDFSTYGTSSTCQKWINLGEACTTENYRLCRLGTECLTSSASATQGTCQAYYSIPGGQTIYTMVSYGSYSIGSYYLCQSGAWDSINKVCFSSPHKLASFPKTCTEDSDCMSINYQEGSTDYSTCSCFPNTKGYKYCYTYPANIDSEYYSWLSKYYAKDLSNCYYYEIGSNYGGACSIGERYLDVWQRSVASEYFPSCGKDVLYDEYRFNPNAEENLILSETFSSRLLTTIFVLLGILLFK